MEAAKRRFATSMTGKMCDSRGAGQPGAEAAAREEAEEAEAAAAFARPLASSLGFPAPAGLNAAEGSRLRAVATCPHPGPRL